MNDTKVIARRRTFDGKAVCLWSDGTLSWALGYQIKGAWMRPRENRRVVALAAGWLVIGDVEIFDAADVPKLAKAARWAVERDGLPGTMRARFAAGSKAAVRPPAGLKPAWTPTATDARGKVTERVWRLPGLGAWAGHAVWDYGSRGGSRGRYDLCSRVGGARSDTTYKTTGMRFTSQRALIAWMTENPPRVLAHAEKSSDNS